MCYLNKLYSISDSNKNKILFLVLFISTLVSGFDILFFNYSMDDAWIKSDNYIRQFSLSGFIDNIMYAYHLLWDNQGRFGGIIPVIRAIDGSLTQNVSYHYILNVIFHGVNACLMYLLCFNKMKLGRKISIITALSFAILLPLRGPLYAVGLFVGSIYVNILTLFLFLLFTINKKNLAKKFIFFLYFILAIGNYSLIVLVPALLMYLASENYSWKKILHTATYLLIPIAINIFIIQFSQPASYEGTKPNLNIIHLYSNIQDIILRLIPFDFVTTATIIFIILSVSIFYIIKFNRYSYQILFSLGLMFGYLSIFSISSRDSFPNPYFLYIPYFGFMLTLGLLFHRLKYGWLVHILCMILLQNGYYHESMPYINFRLYQSDQMEKLKSTIENAYEIAKKDDVENSLIIVLVDEKSINGLHLGYFDKVISTWQRVDDNNYYILSTDYIGSGPDTKFKTGFSQYTDRNVTYRSVSDIVSFYSGYQGGYKGSYLKPSFNDVYIFDSLNKDIKNIVDLKPIVRKKIISLYDSEYNGDYYFTWTNKTISITIEQDEMFASSKLSLSGMLFSIVDNDISVVYQGQEIDNIHLNKNKLTPFLLKVPINQSKESNKIRIDLFASHSTHVSGDNRELAFYIKNSVDIKFLYDGKKHFKVSE
jgi:hypothetical protein